MAVYNNKNTASPTHIARVELAPVAEGNYGFFSVDNAKNKDEAKQWLASVGQKIIGDTVVGGKPMLITHGGKKPDELLKLMADRGDKLVFEPAPAKPIDTWKMIAMLAVPGQMMQLGSSIMRYDPIKPKKISWDLFLFAASNLLGHVIGWTYGSQKTDDEHRLDYAKKHFNDKIGPHIPAGVTLPDIQDDRSSLRDEPAGPKSTWQKVNGFLRKNSVLFGEIFLRFFGGIALIVPANKWGDTIRSIGKGESIKKIWENARNPDVYNRWTGILSLTGKTVAMMSKVPDPYDPKPHTWIDTLREKVTFRAGGWIEALAFGTMAYGATKSTFYPKPGNEPRRLRFGEYVTPDYLGVVGAAMFSVRYMVRHWAKYGEKSFDMEELRAHVTDSLAKLPHDQLPQLIGDAAADLTDHFKDKKLRFGEVYMGLRSEMQRYHSYHGDYGAAPDLAKTQAKIEKHIMNPDPAQAPQPQPAKFASPEGPRNPMERVTVPAGNKADSVTRADQPQRSIAT